MRAARFAALFSLMAVLYFGGIVRAQEPVRTGSIEGTVRVKDAFNAGVEVTAIEADTGRPYFTKTDERGRFRFSGLPPGEFQVFAAAEGFYPVWEVGTVEAETTWRPELSTETRVRLRRSVGLTSRIFFPALDIFRGADAVCLGTITSIHREPGISDDTDWKCSLNVAIQSNLKGEATPRWITVEAEYRREFAENIQLGRQILVCFGRADTVSGLAVQRFFLFPKNPSPMWAWHQRIWELVSIAQAGQTTRPELVEWLVTGIVEKRTRDQATLEVLNILKRSRGEKRADTGNIDQSDPFDLADPEQPLFSEAQMKRIADSIFQDDAVTETDLDVARLLIGLKYAGSEKLLLTRIEKRKTDWTGPTGNLLRLHSSLKTEKEPGRLANLFESVQFAARMKVYLENPNQTQMPVEEQVSRMRVLAEPQLLAILKSYLWTVEHPAKDAK